ncbi:hypothetical protein FQZ97_655760 [compost metagenome]
MSSGALIICQHFVPYTPSVGGVARVVYLARQMVDQGVNVQVLTSTGFNYGFLGFEDTVSGVTTTYLNDPLKVSVQTSLQKVSSNSEGDSFRLSLLRLLKSLVRKLVIPDLGLFMVYKYYREASRLIETGDFGTVIVSTPPHSMQLVGGLLKRKFGDRIRVVADYRDSWNASTIFSRKGRLASYISKRLERFSLESADLVTFVSNPMIAKMSALFPGLNLENKSILVMNGYAGEVYDYVERLSSSPLKIGHFGMADDDPEGYRNIEPLLKSVKKANDQGASLQLIFYGLLRLSKVRLEDYPFVQVFDAVSHRDAIQIMQEMDYLLILHTDPSNSDEVIPGKFFDYLQARRPILCFSPANMEAARMTIGNGLGVWADSESLDDSIATFLKLADESFPKLSDPSFSSSFGRKEQYNKMLSRLSLH